MEEPDAKFDAVSHAPPLLHAEPVAEPAAHSDLQQVCQSGDNAYKISNKQVTGE